MPPANPHNPVSRTPDSGLDKKAIIDVHLKIYEQERAYSKHHEDQRTTITNLIMVLAAGISAIVVFDEKISITDLPLTSLIIVLGFIGMIFSAKHFERSEMHNRKALNHRHAVDHLLPKASAVFSGNDIILMPDENNANKNQKSIPVVTGQQEYSRRHLYLYENCDHQLSSLTLGIDANYKKDFETIYGKKREKFARFIFNRALYKIWLVFYLLIIMLGLILTVMGIVGIAKDAKSEKAENPQVIYIRDSTPQKTMEATTPASKPRVSETETPQVAEEKN